MVSHIFKLQLVLVGIFIFSTGITTAQSIKCDSLYGDLYFTKNNVRLIFSKEDDSEAYQWLKIHIDKKENFNEYMPTIDSIYSFASDLISINLEGITPGYPTEYRDVTNRLAQAEMEDPAWTSTQTKKIQPNAHTLLNKLMVKHDIYLLDEWLKKIGYKIDEINTEKHGYLDKEWLKAHNLPTDAIIMVPFMVWISLKPDNS